MDSELDFFTVMYLTCGTEKLIYAEGCTCCTVTLCRLKLNTHLTLSDIKDKPKWQISDMQFCNYIYMKMNSKKCILYSIIYGTLCWHS